MDIIVKNLKKSFQGRPVLDGFSCQIKQGSTVCIMGPSGSGKSTLLHILMGLLPQDSGMVEGVPERLGAVFQEERLCENLSAMRNIRLACKERVKESMMEEAFRFLDLQDALTRPVRELSGGMRRRVSILRALFAEAECLVMDEPFQGLDESAKERAIGYIREHGRGKTLIVVTHDASDAVRLGADDVIGIP